MIRVAIFDAVLPEQIRVNAEDTADFEVVWTGTDLERLTSEAPLLHPEVLVLALDQLDGDPVSKVAEVQKIIDAELTLVLFTFARRDVLDRVQNEKTRAVKGPLSVRSLKAHMMSVIVRNILSGQAPATRSSAPPPSTPKRVSQPPESTDTSLLSAAPRLYSEAQLARIQEFRSSMECECPNHVAQVVLTLRAYEEYSRNCSSRNDRDAEVHRTLYIKTSQARRIMEEAMQLLATHEGIRV